MPRKKKTIEIKGRRGGKTIARNAAIQRAVADGVTVHVVPANPVPDEDWKVVQVASHMGLSYQTARNQMLSGVFGASKFDAGKRCLTVSANRVKSVKTLRDKPKNKRRSRSA